MPLEGLIFAEPLEVFMLRKEISDDFGDSALDVSVSVALFRFEEEEAVSDFPLDFTFEAFNEFDFS
jgi:hypothetical protein